MRQRFQKKNSGKRVLIALSGGIDSAVSAYLLLQAGYQVEAAFMKNWSKTAGLKVSECPWLQDRQDALRVAAFLRIPLHTLDFENQYARSVMGYFFNEYKAGRTPNPDVMCNKEIKFKLLYQWAMKKGFDYVATGHYAQVKSKKIESGGVQAFELVRSTDEFKDQTYFIYNIRQEQLPHLLFPIGHLPKAKVRALAKQIKLPNAEKKESMGLCFVGKIRLKEFLQQKLKAKAGNIKDLSGRVIGTHQGLYNYTIGQRQGIAVGGSGGPYYVVRKDLAVNTLYVTNNPQDKALETKEALVHSVNWITNNVSTRSLTARYRHQADLVPVTIKQIKKDQYLVQFSKPQTAVASGQSIVLYQGKTCLGGGVIE